MKLSKVTIKDAVEIISAAYKMLFYANTHTWKLIDISKVMGEPCLVFENRYNDHEFWFFDEKIEIHQSDPEEEISNDHYYHEVKLKCYIKAINLGYYVKDITDITDKPLTIETAETLRNAGIKQAQDHADEVLPTWSDIAYDFLVGYINNCDDEFMSEDVVKFAEGVVPEPPHRRAWGSVFVKASKCGLIINMGMRKKKNAKSHCGYATVWLRD